MISRYVRHLFAGGIGTLAYMIWVALFVELFKFHPVISVIFSFTLLEVYTYIINRVWVYNATIRHISAIPRFIIVTIIALLLNIGIMYFVVELMEWNYIWGLFIGACIIPPTNFLLNYYWAFK